MEKNAIIQKSIDLPAPPKDWPELNKHQLFEIHRLLNSGLTLPEYKLKVFLMLMDLKVLKRAEKKDDGSFIYKFRRKGLRAWLRREELSMEAWEVDHWIEKFLGFLNEPFTMPSLPFEHIRVRGRKFMAPQILMANITYEQYGNMQKYLMSYWQLSKVAESMLKNGATRKAVKQMQKQVLDARAGFLSHAYIGRTFRLLDQSHEMTRLRPTWVYAYDSEAAERCKRLFIPAPDYLFDITYQHFQSCQSFYKREYKFLFKEYQDESDKSAFIMEAETINAVMKYAGGYNRQQEVYDSNTVFIFGFLNSMAHEADEIDKMNKKIKAK